MYRRLLEEDDLLEGDPEAEAPCRWEWWWWWWLLWWLWWWWWWEEEEEPGLLPCERWWRPELTERAAPPALALELGTCTTFLGLA